MAILPASELSANSSIESLPFIADLHSLNQVTSGPTPIIGPNFGARLRRPVLYLAHYSIDKYRGKNETAELQVEAVAEVSV
ncbi:hypothetical protein IC235_11875 [Hymenobacter sp. BT664]|uniref:Uncharacterized protein n=1 Tax=Hymenobacter montanus TaxID=2771359 RepID=A0A927BE30_9BACT|nr:hypothetical protein [Hymenobacter montanus]MBD2768585.1 hypothetical protein [Hymenobacter montanus]